VPGPSSPRPAGPSLWRHRDFLLLWGGQSVSAMGDAVSTLALPLVALSALHASTLQVSALAAVGRLPTLLVALPAGAIVDRCRKRPVMLACDLARAGCLGSVPLAAVLGVLSLAQLYAVAFTTALLGVFFDAAYQSLTPLLLTRDRLIDGNGKLGTTDSFAAFAGPTVAGFLIGLAGAARAVAVDAVSYLGSAVSLALIRVREPRPEARSAGTSVRGDVLDGLRFVVRHRMLRSVVACNANKSFFLASVNAIWLVYVVRELHWSPRGAGLVLGIGAAGGVLGGLVARPLVDRYGVARVLLAGELVTAPCELVTPLAPAGLAGQLAITASFVVLLVGAVTYNVTQRTFRQLLCPPALLARMNSAVRWLQWGLSPLGALLGGALGTWLGPRAALLIGASGAALGFVLLVASPVRAGTDTGARQATIPAPSAP
jgi:MFS family permease